jgi:hypothetical protein
MYRAGIMASRMNRMTQLEALSVACLAFSAWPSRTRFVMPGPGSGIRSSASRRPISVPVRPVSVAPRTSATPWTAEGSQAG